MLLKIAWRNIWRSRTRSLVILVSVAVGLWAGIFLLAFYNGMAEQRVRSAIETEISHIQLHHPAFSEDHDLKFFIPDGRKILESIRQSAGLRVAAGRIFITGMAVSPIGSAGVKINAVMPAKEDSLTQLAAKLTSGIYFKDAVKNEILISEKLAQKLKLKVQRKMVLTFSDREGNIASGAFRVAGLYKTINAPYDEANVFIDVDDAAILAGMPGEINEIAILLDADKKLEAFVMKLAKEYPGVEIKKWTEINPEMKLLVTSMDQMMFFFMGIIMLALAFGIINTMLMSVLERTREIGMLLSLGMNKFRIFGMILLETVFLVMAGCPAGIIPALFTVMYTRKTGINLSVFSDTYSSFGYSSEVFPSLDSRDLGMIILLVIFTALVSALFPAWRALKLKPAEAIRK
jgi:ABC-type lipoprotein release transport system permease subunit